MKDRLILVIVAVVLFLQFLYFVGHNPYPHGDILDVSYRRKERMSAYWENAQHPSPEAHAKLAVEMKKLHRYELVTGAATLAILLTIDGFGIYFLMKYARKAKAA
jgi:hypothetical protein